MMRCAIHQPQYLPWMGYFDKMASCDVFVILDDVQFKKNEWQNRNRIRIANDPGWQWLTVPVLHQFGQKINQVKMNTTVDWAAAHKNAIETNYARAMYFERFWPELKPLYECSWDDLSALNIAFIKKLAELLEIPTKIIISSELDVHSTKTERLIDLCRAVGVDTYLAGAGAGAYMDFDQFCASGLKLEVQQYDHPLYEQCWTKAPAEFVSHLSVVDWLFNQGPWPMKKIS